mmetsp:Transcript_32804/g.110561  ORF Transcript_32804/g.110561 Transcript_32804/m.110561 type:complete len:256 (-) Transcript_32804:1562-2329(-)
MLQGRHGRRRPAHALRAREEVQRFAAAAVGCLRDGGQRARARAGPFRRARGRLGLQEIQARAAARGRVDRGRRALAPALHSPHRQGRGAPRLYARLQGHRHGEERLGRGQDAAAGDVREHDGGHFAGAGPRAFEGDCSEDCAHGRSGAGHVRPTQEDGRLHAGPVPRQLRPGDAGRRGRERRGPQVHDATRGGRRPVLQRRRDAENRPNRGGQRRPPHLARQGRPGLDAGHVGGDPRERAGVEEMLWGVYPHRVP